MVCTRVCIAILSLGLFLHVGSGQESLIVTTTEKGFLSLATRVVVPSFPPKAFALHEFGVAVAQVHLDTSGAIKSVSILESPGPEVSASMTSAIRAWTFPPRKDSDGHLLVYSSKITYYFLSNGGKPAVYSPTDSFYCGPQPTSR